MGISFIDTNERHRGETQLDLPPGMGFVAPLLASYERPERDPPDYMIA
jgi:hypothetical protein